MNIIDEFRDLEILVVGDVMLDKYLIGSSNRISPEAPVPVVNIKETQLRAGGAANVALNLASLGVKASLYGFYGFDEAANDLDLLLKEHNIQNHLQKIDMQTIVKLRILSRHQQLLRLDFEDEIIDTSKYDIQIDNKIKIIILSDYNKGVLQKDTCQNIIKKANEKHIKVLADPKGDDWSKYQNAYLLTPNQGEFEAIVGKCANQEILISKAREIIAKFNLSALLITQSEKGMTYVDKENDFHLEAKTQDVFDVTGAGDTVLATFAAALAANKNYEQATYLANLAASIVVAKVGTAQIQAIELKNALKQFKNNDRILSLQDLKEKVKEAKQKGLKIAFTNGCFDILHQGHTFYLEQAREQGDLLIVALNSDASIKRLKGEDRPVNNLEARAKVLASLRSVDFVTSFNDDTPENLLKELQPDILVKGGDYTKNQVVGWEIVENYGGQVKVLGLINGSSTTNIINKIIGSSIC